MKMKLGGTYTDGSPKFYMLPESKSQTDWIRKHFDNGGSLKARIIGDEECGLMLQFKIDKKLDPADGSEPNE